MIVQIEGIAGVQRVGVAGDGQGTRARAMGAAVDNHGAVDSRQGIRHGSDVDDIRTLAINILYLLNNPHLIEEMGTKGREHISSNYDINKNIHKYKSYYEKAYALAKRQTR